MENNKSFEIKDDSNDTSPLSLQYLCSKIIIEQSNSYLSPYKEDTTVPNEYCNNINMRINNLNKDSLSQHLNCSPEINNLELDVLGMEELDNCIQDLKIDPFSELDSDFKELFERDINQNVDMPRDIIDSKVVAIENDTFKSHCKEKDKIVNSIRGIFKNSEHSESKIDSVSLQSTGSRNVQVEKSKITTEINPQIHYIANVNTDCCNKIKDDIIIISSDSEFDDSCGGYHSSDFEFITEGEARNDDSKSSIKTNKIDNEVSKTVEGTQKPGCSNNNNVDYRQHHRIPVGEGYFDLFRGYHAPTTPFMFENKCMGLNEDYAGVGFDMRVLSRQIQEFSDDDEFKEEAEECAKKILKMYPRENRKRRRRFI